MNAYELAKKLEWYSNYPEFVEAGQMLRQQADRIAELEKDLAKYDELAIDDLEGKRIIWCACGDGITPDSGAVCGNCLASKTITPQIKELSDEEILAEWKWKWLLDAYDDYIVAFARAILKKASEK